MESGSDSSAGRAIIELPWSCPPLSLNQRGASRGARFMHAKMVAQVREEVYKLAFAHRLPRGLSYITVQLHYRPRDRRRRDTDNLVATAKPIYDALTAGRPAGISRRRSKDGQVRVVPAQLGYGMVADDTPDFMGKPEPIITPAVKGLPGAMWLEISWPTTASEVPSNNSADGVRVQNEPDRNSHTDSPPAAVPLGTDWGSGADRVAELLRGPSIAQPSPVSSPLPQRVSLQSAASPLVSLQGDDRAATQPTMLRDHTRCVVCGGPITQPGVGRPRKTCSGACRVRAHRGKK